jgi:hypothetical protein
MVVKRRAQDAHVLVLTHSEDGDVPERVAKAVRARGASCTRIDTDLLPRLGALTLGFPHVGMSALWTTADEEVDLTRATAIWCRRLWPAAKGTGARAAFEDAAGTQARDALFGALAALSASVRLINDPHAQQRAEHKALQLAHAVRAGFKVPATTITNDPASARAFVQARIAEGERVFTKLLVPLSQSMSGAGPHVPTSMLDAADARALDAIQHAPQILQAAIDKRADVRVVVVGKRVFAGALTARRGDPLDWRTGPRRTWRAIEVPPAVQRATHRLMRALAIDTGVFDFIEDRARGWHFLEVNPAGEWGFLADDLKAPIPQAFAELLAP